MSHTITPTRLVLELEANGPTATQTRRAWHVLASLLRTIDPETHDVEISHRALAMRGGYASARTVSRALAELVDAGLIEHRHGDRVGHGTTEVRVSYVRVWSRPSRPWSTSGREFVRDAIAAAAAITQARMRALLDYRARKRAARRAAVDKLAGLLDVALDPQTRRSPVVGQ